MASTGSPSDIIDSATGLAALFARHRDRPWYFGHSGGNWGDYLIWAGAEKLARETGLKWTNFDFRTVGQLHFAPGAAIYLHGGGCLNPWYADRGFNLLRAALAVPDAVVIQGPQTCDVETPETQTLFVEALIGAASSDVHFFAREWTSAAFMADLVVGRARIHLAEDCAFLLNRDDLLSLAGLRCMPRGRYLLWASRDDAEAPVVPMGLQHGHDVTLDPVEFATSFPHWLRLHAKASRIVTNRLHTAIVGTILGKPVALTQGSYHKNRSVWEYSLRDRGVAWRESAQELGEEEKRGLVSVARWLPARMAASWKVRRALLWLHGVPLD